MAGNAGRQKEAARANAAKAMVATCHAGRYGSLHVLMRCPFERAGQVASSALERPDEVTERLSRMHASEPPREPVRFRSVFGARSG